MAGTTGPSAFMKASHEVFLEPLRDWKDYTMKLKGPIPRHRKPSESRKDRSDLSPAAAHEADGHIWGKLMIFRDPLQ